MKQIFSLFFILFFLTGNAASPLAAEALNPQDTYALIVGVLQWQNPGLHSFSTRNRKDQELYQTLLKRGVPASQMTLLLDRQATLSAVRQSLIRLASQAKPPSTFIFYYAGHGLKSTGDANYFANYDLDPKRMGPTGLKVSEIGSWLKSSFKGRRVLLMGDSCYSGALKGVSELLSRQAIESVSLTSAESSNLSSGNWTFTQTIIDTLRGNPLADADRNGEISLEELAHEIATAMKYRERQKSGYFNQGVSSSLAIAKTNPSLHSYSGAGNYVSAWDGRQWSTARILDAASDPSLVQFYRYSDPIEKRVPSSQIKKIEFKHYPPGSNINVTWAGRPYAAHILKVEDDFHRITYPGWPSYWDEWVMDDRILASTPTPTLPAQAILAEWHGHWWPASILQQKGTSYLIHYTGYHSSWDEWVSEERIRR